MMTLEPDSAVTVLSVKVVSVEPAPFTVKTPPRRNTGLAAATRTGFSTGL